MSICSICGSDKPQIEFEKSKQTKTGRTKRCLVCNAKRTKKWRKDNPELVEKMALSRVEYFKEWERKPETRKRRSELRAMWRKENPGIAHSRDAKSRERESWKQYHAEYKKQHALEISNWHANNYKRNRIEILTRNDKWLKSNPDKARVYVQNRRNRKSGGKLTSGLVLRLMEQQQGKCVYCKRELSETGYDMDHIMPLAKGGKHEDENIQLLCPTCNGRKHAKLPEFFERQMGIAA